MTNPSPPPSPTIAARFSIDPNDLSTSESESRAYDLEEMEAAVARSREFELVDVEYVDNPALREAFEATRSRFEADGKESEELLVYHGTLLENIEPIVRQGFKIGGQSCQESRYPDKSLVRWFLSLGYGIYTARSLPSAAVYSKQSLGPDGLIRVIGLLALRGAAAHPQLGARKAKNAVPMDQADSFDNGEWCGRLFDCA
ncbi:hypothetical protein BCR44DRAFT_1459095 [Catenaria anguillulae PL171]|uniref:PARP catalytic domain-containing protein n=1 Tax=Catenaria anguillulae PL171 TaxID=765915 RepID=A0A1Y2HW99_9FUNG|nr:hypothetical protein BCR44DRAFT_1459095 [Catenaria anguillulae PL171]